MKPFDTTGAFRGLDESRVQRLAIRGAGVTMLSSGVSLTVQILATMVLGRLLTQKDFGVVTMVTTFSLLLVNFGLNGFTEAVLQREDIDHFLASNLFWVSVSGGLFLTLGFAASGSLLARFYHDPSVAGVTAGIAITILITSTSVMHLALLKRAMRFSLTSAIELSSRISMMAVSILLAWTGWGYWALVLGAVAQAFTLSAGAWLMCQWIPGLPRKAPGTAAMVRLAAHVYGRFSVNYLARNVDNLLVGWSFGAISLGFYKKAYDLFALSAGQLAAPLANIAVSALSRFDPRSVQYRRNLLRALSVMAFVGMALAVDLTLIGQDLIRVLLGPGWEQAVRIFTFFGPGIGIMLIYYMHGWIHLSIGRADRWFRWGIVEVTVTCLFFLIALPWGPAGIAFAWTASFWFLTIPAFWYAGRPIGLGIRPVIAAAWKFVLSSVLAGLGAVGIIRSTPSLFTASGSIQDALVRIAEVSLLFGALYSVAVVVLHRSCEPFYQVARLLREMISLTKPQETSAVEVSIVSAGESPVPLDPAWKPLVSILIPAYNAQEWIADTIRSAMEQTWEPKEIIVVDDGSKDQTVAIAQQFESASVRVVQQLNQGAAAARNKAFSLSRGEYIQWLDADDLLAPDKIATQMAVLERSPNKPALLSSAFGRFKYCIDRAEFLPTALWCDLTPVEWLLRKLGQNVYMQTATWLVSRELTEAAGPWDTRLLSDDDGEYFCRVLLASGGVRFVPESRVYYRAPWVDTLSYIGASNRKIEAHWWSMQLHIGYLRSLEDSSRVRAACLRYLQTCLPYFHPERPDILKDVEQMASDLGGKLETPRLSWKYRYVRSVFGWALAKRLQIALPRIKWWIVKTWDYTLFRFSARTTRVRVAALGALAAPAPSPDQKVRPGLLDRSVLKDEL